MPPDKFSYPDKPGQPFVIPKEEMPQVKSLSDRELKELGLIEGKSKRKRISRENVEVSPETAKARFSPFLADTFHGWYDSAKTRTPAEIDSAAQHLPEMIEPTHIDWTVKKDDIDVAKFGEYTLNPDTLSIDWETIPQDKIKIITLPEALSGKPLAEVAKYIIDTYSSDYHLPGIEYWQYILNNPDKAPAELKDKKNYHFFFGSVFRDANGDWHVPYARWGGAVWFRYANWLAFDWFSDYRVVLVEK